MKVVSMPRAKEFLSRDCDIEKMHDSIREQFGNYGQVAAAIVPSNANPATSPLVFVFGTGESILVLLKQDAKEYLSMTGDDTFVRWIERVTPNFSDN